MSKERSPRAVCSTTIGTSGIRPPIRGLTAPGPYPGRPLGRDPRARRGAELPAHLAVAGQRRGERLLAEAEAGFGEREGGAGEALRGRAGSGEEAALLAAVAEVAPEVQREPGDGAGVAGDFRQVGVEDVAEGALGRLDLEGQGERGGNGVRPVDVGEDRRLALEAAVEGVDLAVGREGRLLAEQDFGRELAFPAPPAPAGLQR